MTLVRERERDWAHSKHKIFESMTLVREKERERERKIGLTLKIKYSSR